MKRSEIEAMARKAAEDLKTKQNRTKVNDDSKVANEVNVINRKTIKHFVKTHGHGTQGEREDLKVCGEYLQAIKDGNNAKLAELAGGDVKVMGEGVDTAGGHAVPTEFNRQLIRRLVDLPSINNIVRPIPMATNSMDVPAETGSVTVDFVAEDADINASDALLGDVNLTAFTMSGLTRMSNRLLAHWLATPELTGLLLDQYAVALAQKMDDAICTGTGHANGQPIGLQTEVKSAGGFALVKEADANNAITLEKLIQTTNTPTDAVRRNGAWIMRRDIYAHILGIKSGDNFLFAGNVNQGAVGPDGPVRGRLLGYPVYFNDSLSKTLTIADITAAKAGVILFGDPNQYLLGEPPRAYEAALSPHEGDNFKKDRTSLRVIAEMAGNIAQKAGWVAHIYKATP